MILRFYISLILLMCFYFICQSQELKFSEEPIVHESGNKIEYTHESEEYYNYFTKEFDSNWFIGFVNPKYKTIAKIDKINGFGSYEIYNKDFLMCSIEIRDFEINGIGTIYNLDGSVMYHASFKNGILHGITILYDTNKKITDIALFKKGKYKKHLFCSSYFGKQKIIHRIPFKLETIVM